MLFRTSHVIDTRMTRIHIYIYIYVISVSLSLYIYMYYKSIIITCIQILMFDQLRRCWATGATDASGDTACSRRPTTRPGQRHIVYNYNV